MNDTPETDAAYKYWPSENAELVDAALARKLERERDEAIRQRDETNRSSKYACDYNYEQKLKAERERDEANYFLKELAEVDGQLKVREYELCEVLRKTEKERDEYRRQLTAATSALRQIHLEVGDWIRSTIIVEE